MKFSIELLLAAILVIGCKNGNDESGTKVGYSDPETFGANKAEYIEVIPVTDKEHKKVTGYCAYTMVRDNSFLNPFFQNSSKKFEKLREIQNVLLLGSRVNSGVLDQTIQDAYRLLSDRQKYLSGLSKESPEKHWYSSQPISYEGFWEALSGEKKFGLRSFYGSGLTKAGTSIAGVSFIAGVISAGPSLGVGALLSGIGILAGGAVAGGGILIDQFESWHDQTSIGDKGKGSIDLADIAGILDPFAMTQIHESKLRFMKNQLMEAAKSSSLEHSGNCPKYSEIDLPELVLR